MIAFGVAHQFRIRHQDLLADPAGVELFVGYQVQGSDTDAELAPMLGFKNCDYAAITIGGVELLHRIRKGQFALHRLRLKGRAAAAIWNAVLAA